MRKKGFSNLVLKTTEEIFSSLVDLILWNLFYWAEMSPLGHPANLGKAEFLANKNLQKFNYISIKRAISHAKIRGFIKEDFTLTKEGKERLENILPKSFGERKWSGDWYLVIYDVPEKFKSRRDVLRESLKRLGFGEIGESCWVSPFNFFGEVEKIVKEYNLSKYVIFAISNKLGREQVKILTNKIWRIERINNRYKNLIRESKKIDAKELVFKYLDILRDDPQLPQELLPNDWNGKEALRIFKKFVKF